MDYGQLFDLAGRRALVTGASSGLGEHFATVLAKAGAEVILVARRLEKLESVCEAIRSQGGVARPVVMDVTSPQSVDAAFDAITDLCGGPCDIIINNSGIGQNAWLAKLEEDEWAQIVDTNLSGVWRVAKRGANELKAHGLPGSIINIGSITGLRPALKGGAYAASKAAVLHLTKCLAIEFAHLDIRVNAIAPGYFRTELSKDLLDSEHGEVMRNRITMKRYGVFDNLTGPLMLLASEAGAFMTGETIVVDGGHTLTPL